MRSSESNIQKDICANHTNKAESQHTIQHGTSNPPDKTKHKETAYSSIISQPRTDPRVWIIVLIKVPERSSSSEAWYSSVRCTKLHNSVSAGKRSAKTYDDMVLPIEEIRRVPREVLRRRQPFMAIELCRCPLPDTTVGPATTIFLKTGRRSDYRMSKGE